ncbi:hypothetical protein F8163_12625 [Bacillus luti]|uniref:Uncharacterized protein n=2 Tax=Bacillus luti TaxID=2026191 RepID=A0A7V7S7Y4_9BACI|nr:hypothetical protein F8163_12625 [Bacillus luti]
MLINYNTFKKEYPYIEKARTLLTNQEEVKAQLEKVYAKAKKLQDIKPPKQYENLQLELKKSLILYEKSIDKMLEGVDEINERKVDIGSESMDEALEMSGKALDDIRALDEQSVSEVE